MRNIRRSRQRAVALPKYTPMVSPISGTLDATEAARRIDHASAPDTVPSDGGDFVLRKAEIDRREADQQQC